MAVYTWARERAAAERALRQLETGVIQARAELNRGEIPSGSLTEAVTEFDRAVTALSVIDDLGQGPEGARP